MFQKKVFLMFSYISIAVIVAFSAIFYLYSLNNKKEIMGTYFSGSLENATDQLEGMFDNMDTISTQIFSDRNVQNIFLNISHSDSNTSNYFEHNLQDKRLLENIFISNNSPKSTVRSIHIFSEPCNFVGLQEYYPSTSTIKKNTALDKWNVSEGYYKVLSPHKDDWQDRTTNPDIVVSLVRPLTTTHTGFEHIGTIEVVQDYSKIEEICKTENNMEIIILDSDGNTVYPYNSSVKKESYTYLLNKKEGDLCYFKSDNSKQMVGCYSKLTFANWTLMLIQPRDVYNQSIYNLLTLVIIICLCILVITITIIYISTNMITRPIRQLRESVKDVSLNNPNLNIPNSDINEIKLLENAFNDMVIHIQSSANELIQSHESEMKSKLSALQSKINPHFLYNSLMAISAAGQEAQSDKVQIMCQELSSLFRYASSDDGSKITLKDEIENVATYLHFMKWRYEDNFKFEIIESKDAGTIEVPRLILQPIAENCFSHGYIQVAPPYYLRLENHVDSDGWVCKITDNGGGFSKETVNALLSEKQKIDETLRKKQISLSDIRTNNKALINIYIRLRLNFGENIIFDVGNNKENRGAYIHIGVKNNRRSQ